MKRERERGKRWEFIGSDLRWTIKMLGTWLGCRGQLFTVTDRQCRRGSGICQGWCVLTYISVFLDEKNGGSTNLDPILL